MTRTFRVHLSEMLALFGLLCLCCAVPSFGRLNPVQLQRFRNAHRRSNNNLFFEAMANMRKRTAILKQQEPTVALRVQNGKQVTYSTISQINHNYGVDEELFEGDMFLTNEQTKELLSDFLPKSSNGSRPKRQTFIGGGYPKNLWPVFYYEVKASMNARAKQTITEAIKFWQANTCVKFVPSKTQRNRVQFFTGNGCYSEVGMLGGVQGLSIGHGCEYTGIVIHEIGHALGFYHTQERQDRDNAIELYLQNVLPGQRYNFQKMTVANNQNYGTPYDYGSVMQYEANSFGIGGRATMHAKVAKYQDTMGSYLPSFYDVYMINQHYKCKCPTKLGCANGGIQNPKSCNQCICPSGYGGAQCTIRAPGCGATLQATFDLKTEKVYAGSGEVDDRIKFGICNWLIKGPKGKKIEVTIKKVNKTFCYFGCYRGGIEIKAIRDHRYTGIRYCCNADANTKIVSEANVVPVIVFNSYSKSEFVISYRFVPSATPSTVRLAQIPGAKATL